MTRYVFWTIALGLLAATLGGALSAAVVLTLGLKGWPLLVGGAILLGVTWSWAERTYLVPLRRRGR